MKVYDFFFKQNRNKDLVKVKLMHMAFTPKNEQRVSP